MTIAKFFQELSLSGWTSLVIILLSFIEIVPIKISPLNWLGKRVNAETIKDLKLLDEKVCQLDNKLDQHVAESYRNSILRTQDRLLMNKKMTLEEWAKVIETIDDYNSYCEANNITNGVVKEATKYIKHEYQKALDTNDFLSLPVSNIQ